MTKQPSDGPGRAIKKRVRFQAIGELSSMLRLAPSNKAHSYETVLGILLFGTGAVFILLLLPLLFSAFVAGNSYVLGRVVVCCGIVLFIGMLFVLWKKYKLYKMAAVLLVLFYGLTTTLGAVAWGINNPFVILLSGLVVVLTGILLGSKIAFWAAGIQSVIFFILQTLLNAGLYIPEQQRAYPSQYGDIVGYSILLGILALVSWISNRQLEQSLLQAVSAEEELLKEKQSLADKLDERTRLLRAAQLQEMQELYRFAELGQLSTALLHDLSNHLTVLTLDIEDLQKKQHSRAIKRAKHTMLYLDKIVDQVRTKLREERQIEKFKVNVVIHDVLRQLRSRTQKYQVPVELHMSQSTKRASITGDSIRLNQILAILISNAIDACRSATPRGSIVVDAQMANATLKISIRDTGLGVQKSDYDKLFKPFYSTKADGMGIGLFIARQMVETHFHGTIRYISSPASAHTEFIVTIPLDGSA